MSKTGSIKEVVTYKSPTAKEVLRVNIPPCTIVQDGGAIAAVFHATLQDLSLDR